MKQEELTKVSLTETEYSSDSEELGLQPYHSTSNYHNIRYSQYESRLKAGIFVIFVYKKIDYGFLQDFA
jgi:hypothetical protein